MGTISTCPSGACNELWSCAEDPHDESSYRGTSRWNMQRRGSMTELRHKEWLLTASPHDWVLHQIPLSEHMREELHELDILREQARQRGGMITGKVPLRVYLVHMEEMQQWKVDADMDIEYLIKALRKSTRRG